MHIAPPHQQESIEYELYDSNLDTLPGDVGLSELTLITTGLVMWNQTRAFQLAQSIQDAWTKAAQYIQLKQKNNFLRWLANH